MISNLEVKFPGVKARLCDENGALRRFVNIYINEEDIRFLKGEATALKMAMRFPSSRRSREAGM